MDKRGSALLIAVFLVAAVGGVAFAIGRLFALDTTLASLYENSTVAYYAAESGVEEGYLRYKYDKNSEIHADDSSSQVNRSQIDGQVLIDDQDPTQAPGSNALRFYDLSMFYRANYYGSDMNNSNSLTPADLADGNYSKEYFIPRDESTKIDISDVTQSSVRDLKVFVQFRNDADTDVCLSSKKPFIEAKFTGTTPFSSLHSMDGLSEWKIALVDNNKMPPSSVVSLGSYIGANADSNGVLTFNNVMANTRLVLQGASTPAIFVQNSKAEISIKPLICSARIGIVINPSTSATRISSPYSTIKSTGHYGGITRTIEAKIDRQAGTVYDLFDYVMYQQ